MNDLKVYGDEDSFGNEDVKTALRTLPKEYRAEVSRVWMFNAHLLPSPLVLCVRTKYWISECGLTAADLGEIVAKLMAPERSAKHRFAADLVTDLSTEVGIVTQRRKSQREAEERRRMDDRRDAHADRQKVAEMVREYTNRINSRESPLGIYDPAVDA